MKSYFVGVVSYTVFCILTRSYHKYQIIRIFVNQLLLTALAVGSVSLVPFRTENTLTQGHLPARTS